MKEEKDKKNEALQKNSKKTVNYSKEFEMCYTL